MFGHATVALRIAFALHSGTQPLVLPVQPNALLPPKLLNFHMLFATRVATMVYTLAKGPVK